MQKSINEIEKSIDFKTKRLDQEKAEIDKKV